MGGLRIRARRAQEGVVLFIALIVLVAMSLAGLALMRSVDTGALIAANLGFKQSSLAVGDLGAEVARTWLMSASSTTLENDSPGDAYYATFQSGLDLLGNDPDTSKPDYNWSSAKEVTAPVPPAGYTVRYVIHRLCGGTGKPTDATANCVTAAATGTTTQSGTKGAAAYGTYAISTTTNAFYRITVQVTGPRNALSYVQTTVF